jgi:GT2 family glycosyltransferase
VRGDHVKIVLPCTNEGPWLRATVDSLLDGTDYPSFEILVVANGDTVTDFAFAREPRYRGVVAVVDEPECLGVGNGVNRGVTPGDAAYYVFLDAHCLVDHREWLAKAVACLEENPRASMIQPEVVQFIYEPDLAPADAVDRSRLREEYRAYSIVWTWPYEYAEQLAAVQTRPARPQPYEAMAGGGMAVFAHAEIFHRLGKYDPEVGGWYPETMDYCARAWMLGYPMIVEPRVRIFHRLKTAKTVRRLDSVHGVLRTAYKYLSPRRRECAELLFRKHGLGAEVQEALARIKRGNWLQERAEHLRNRIHDDDWLFAKFEVYEEHFGIFG